MPQDDPYEYLDPDFGKVLVYLKELEGGFRALVPVEEKEVKEREFANSYGGG